MIEERDISVVMRDGTRLAVDVYRPDGVRQISRAVRISAAQQGHSGPRHRGHIAAATCARASLVRPIEAGDTRRFIANGYVHVIAQPRGSAKSEGHYGHEDTDHHDLIE